MNNCAIVRDAKNLWYLGEMPKTCSSQILNHDTIGSMSEQRISTAPVQGIARAKGIDNPYRLSKLAGISYNTAKRYWYDDPERQQLWDDILLKLSEVLECEPGELIIKYTLD